MQDGVMHQYAWLDFHGIHWRLITGNANDRFRKRTNRDRALSDLTAEGWIVNGPHGRRPTMKHSANRHFYGYALKRTVH
jgi:hypothetical protein